MFGVVRLQSLLEIARKNIYDVFDSYFSHWQVKIKPSILYAPQNHINEITLVH